MSATVAPTDPAAWDAFARDADPSPYLQLSPWAEVKAHNGWSAHRVLADGPGAAIGAQILLRRPGSLPWAFAYAPRGPVTSAWSPDAIGPFTERVREALGPRGSAGVGRVSHLRIDPEIEVDGELDRDGALRASLRRAGWTDAPPIQPGASRLIDLRADEDALWGDLRKKWRQYVNKARSGGVTVEDADANALPVFHEIYRETAARAGFLIRSEEAYRQVWDAYRPHGLARLLVARLPDGEPAAVLFLVRGGNRVVEPYGGMTQAGAESRANYLLKWEAIRSSREAGATTYDLWGLSHAGIAHFKAGFGGREVRYIGAWDLVLDRLGRTIYDTAQKARVFVIRARHGLDPRHPVSAGGAEGGTGQAEGADA